MTCCLLCFGLVWPSKVGSSSWNFHYTVHVFAVHWCSAVACKASLTFTISWWNGGMSFAFCTSREGEQVLVLVPSRPSELVQLLWLTDWSNLGKTATGSHNGALQENGVTAKGLINLLLKFNLPNSPPCGWDGLCGWNGLCRCVCACLNLD